MKRIASIITFIIHPATLAVPTVFLIVFHELGSVSAAFSWSLFSIVFIAIILSFVFYGVKKKFFSNADISIRRQRRILYPFIIGISLFGLMIAYILRAPMVLLIAGFFLVISLIIFDIINLRIKASWHVASITTFSIILISLYGGLAYLTIFLIPAVAWARIIEHRHTLKETVVGAVSSAAITIIALYVIQYLSTHVKY